MNKDVQNFRNYSNSKGAEKKELFSQETHGTANFRFETLTLALLLKVSFVLTLRPLKGINCQCKLEALI